MVMNTVPPPNWDYVQDFPIPQAYIRFTSERAEPRIGWLSKLGICIGAFLGFPQLGYAADRSLEVRRNREDLPAAMVAYAAKRAHGHIPLYAGSFGTFPVAGALLSTNEARQMPKRPSFNRLAGRANAWVIHDQGRKGLNV